MIIGIDIGWTIKGIRIENNKNKTAPNSFDTIKSWVERGDTIYLISKANSTQKEKVETWLSETNFFEFTGVNAQNLYFCHERRDKKFFVEGLGVQIMIDDRAEVLANINLSVIKFLLNPELHEYEKFKKDLFNVRMVTDWYQIENAMR